jgi:hypothetical protein
MYRQKVVCYIYDDPVDFKKLKIYPVKVSEYLDFYNYIDCLQIDKNSVPDVNVISMSYLDYLISISDGSNYYSSKMILLLKLCLHLRDFAIITEDEARVIYESGKNLLLSKLESPEKDEDVIVINSSVNKSWDEISKIIKNESPEGMFYFDEGDIIQVVKKKNKSLIQIKDGFYSSEDFDEIKKIILEQNDVEEIDEQVRKEYRDELERARIRANNANSKDKMCDFENQMICVSVALCCSLDEVKEFTIRKFKKYIARINHKMTYEIFKPAILSGNITSKDKGFPSFWMADLESESKYSGVLVEEDDVNKKLQ